MKANRGGGKLKQQVEPLVEGRRSIPVLRWGDPAHRDLYRRLQRVLASAKSVTIVCGAGISTGSGIPDFRSADGLYNLNLPDLGASTPASQLFDEDTLRSPAGLAAFGRITARLRMQARDARPTPCHTYIAKLHETGRLLRCYTQNIDGLQTRDRPEMSDVVLELHGSNVELFCHICGEKPGEDVRAIDQRLVEEGFVECQACLTRERGTGQWANCRLRSLAPGYLMPKVVFNQGSREHECGGLDLEELEEADGQAKLLLVIGTSISADGSAKLVKSLAKNVHRSGGAVVYVNRTGLPDGKWANHFDVHLEADVDEWAADASLHLATAGHRSDTGREVIEVLQAFQHLPLDPPRYQLVSNHRSPGDTTSKTGAASSLARALAVRLVASCEQRGWTHRGYVVVLSGSRQLSSQVPEWTNYRLLVVHLSDYIFSLSAPGRRVETEQGIREPLAMSACVMRELASGSDGSTALMICAEDELLCEQSMGSLNRAFRR
ncbi:hypothetical protein FRC06_006084 [Ceratobasidium sp. 370]|nr:hypothetical protein FRC06_006084 [Ceratobasidium sp. 370]